jgi:hypothetical protein
MHRKVRYQYASLLTLAAAMSSTALAQTGGPRDSVLLRVGYMSISSSGVLQNQDSSIINGGFEYNRTFNPRVDLRIGARFTQSSRLKRLQMQESMLGGRYYPLSLGTDFSGPVGGYSLKWNFMYKPYIESQLAMGNYVGDVFGDPAVYNLSSGYFALGGGAGCKFQIISGIALDVGINYQVGMSDGSSVVLDPNIMHAYLGIAASLE